MNDVMNDINDLNIVYLPEVTEMPEDLVTVLTLVWLVV